LPDPTPDSLLADLGDQPAPPASDESFPRLVRPAVFGWLWAVLAILMAALVVVLVQYVRGSG
jgi:hypothetical protein